MQNCLQSLLGPAPGASQIGAADRERLRAHQIGAVIALSPAMMAANVVNCIVLVLLFRHTGHRAFLTLWAGALFLVLGAWLQQWWAIRGRRRERASARGTRRVAVTAAAIALLWAAPSLFLFGDATDAQRGMLAACQAGMMTGGAIALATVWQAAAIYVGVIETAALIAFVGYGGAAYLSLAVMSTVFSVIIAAVVVERGRMVARIFLANRELQDKSEVISLLLREFEANASDWLFEIDAEARLVRVSQRLAAVLGDPVAALEGREIAAFFADSGARARNTPFARLARAFRHRQPFRDIVVPATVGGQARVWSLSARPVYDVEGGFRGFLGVGADVTEAHRAEASIRRMANYDLLTGLPNRTQLHAHLDAALARMQKDARGFAVLSLDLDRFKQVNDTLGHGVGDRLLMEVGRRIAAELREDDIVARFGGDEFVVLQHSAAEAAQADALARRLVEALSAPYEIDGQQLLIGASLGIALAPADGDNGDDLLRNSDLALYRAKESGRGAHRFFSAEMHAVSQARRLLEIDLREALQAGGLDVHFQPLVDLDDAEITACEALARWRHPTRGFIPPAEFVPLAEETGLILTLGAFVLRRACEAAVGWRNGARVAVNLSAIQFKTGDLVGLVKTTLAETGLAPNRLELEITESILIEDKDGVLRRLSELRALGVRIALDDFGTGYSSLAYLQSFPFDKIKIDRSFVQDVVVRPDAAAIIGAITKLATTLGMCTTAEGVETEAELDWLRDNGCGQVQGYLISRPLPAKAIAIMMGARAACTSRRDLAA